MEFVKAQRSQKPGDKLTLTYLRGKTSKDVEITLTPRPGVRTSGYLGVSYGPTTSTQGVSLRAVTKGGPADKAGIKAGDVLTSFNDKALRSPRELEQFLSKTKPGAKVKFKYLRNDKPLSTEATLGKYPQPKPSTRPYGFLYGGPNNSTCRTFKVQRVMSMAASISQPMAETPGHALTL